MKSVAARLGVVVLFVLGASGGCPPTPPTCSAPTCSAGQILTCGRTCATPIPLGAACSTDRCAPNGYCASAGTCISFVGSDSGTCINGLGLGQPCDPGLFECTNSLFCHNASCDTPPDRASVCRVPQAQDATCDSDFAHPSCSPCDAQYRCVPADGSARNCRTPCQSDTDCPCNSGLTCLTSTGNIPGGTVPPNFCYPCHKLGNSCSAVNPCCDGSSCSGGVCCLAAGTACSGTNCCGGLVCARGAAGQAQSCQQCHSLGAFCESDLDCCAPNLTCDHNLCKTKPGAACTSANNCSAGNPCTCGLCGPPAALGSACSKQGPSCQCSAANPNSHCDWSTSRQPFACCVTCCQVCTQMSDCCQNSLSGTLIDCRIAASGSQVKRCCGTQSQTADRPGAPCNNDSDCCQEFTCDLTKHQCKLASGNFHAVCTGNGSCSPTGCAASGAKCSASLPCCPGATCVAGVCGTPQPAPGYHVVGYEFGVSNANLALVGSAPFFDYAVPSNAGTPVSVSAQFNAWVVTQNPDKIIDIDSGAATGHVIAAFRHPYKINVIMPPGAGTTADVTDAIIAEGSNASWYEQLNGATGAAFAAHVVVLPSGTTNAQSPDPLFDQINQNWGAVTTVNPNHVYYIDYARQLPNQAPNPAAILGSYDLGAGVPVDVDAQPGQVWVATKGNNQLTRLNAPTFTTSPTVGPLGCEPVTLDGGPSLTPDLVVVACKGATAETGILKAFHGGNPLDATPIVINFSGTPVAMKVAVLSNSIEFVAVATTAKSGNQLQIFNITAANNNPSRPPDATAALAGVPIDLALGIPLAGIPPLPPGFAPGSQTSAIELIVRE